MPGADSILVKIKHQGCSISVRSESAVDFFEQPHSGPVWLWKNYFRPGSVFGNSSSGTFGLGFVFGIPTGFGPVVKKSPDR